ncbi:hypothetical protein AVEN_108307-1 [Araneus ventricosus]|uniref:Uncharacterized protein n=1 Tax=Araneus ventricosus TaxID=182803 RepID=A0A4Y2T005_ARAVE|nr:hypothetical protein AVEN_108307-1 [Araneus ventricosus]
MDDGSRQFAGMPCAILLPNRLSSEDHRRRAHGHSISIANRGCARCSIFLDFLYRPVRCASIRIFACRAISLTIFQQQIFSFLRRDFIHFTVQFFSPYE